MTTVEQDEPRAAVPDEQDARPIDVAQVDADTAWALEIRFDVPDRPTIDVRTLRIAGALNLLVREGLGEENPDFRALHREADGLLKIDTSALTDTQAYDHCRALARIARTFCLVYSRTRRHH
ncbi:hypothetical protein [Streptomyces sp. MZ04]|uniref:hypothetical protein n=1 Tax=Streptomyces sp. MZ04 TaxID=2559236 RepID=UPI00107E90B7|nr:hypothetical protein [Streptomyces sp. MZ04]TGB05762.1 hypothetical protein E2651_24295 [Streptomyces sp. MZ04]